MHKTFRRCLFALAFLTATGYAQDAKPVYTAVALWDVHRGDWAAFAQYVEKYEIPAMEKMLADGVLIEWGFDADALHSPQGYTHSTWMSAHSMADLEKAQGAIVAAMGDQRQTRMAELEKMVSKHQDLYYRSAFFGSRPARLTGGYAFGSWVRVKRGNGTEFRKAWEEWAKPIYDQLLADGVIVSYVMASPLMHTGVETLGEMSTWYVVEDIANDQKVEQAFDAAREKLGQAERDARQSHYWSLIVEDSHRDGLTRIVHYQTR